MRLRVWRVPERKYNPGIWYRATVLYKGRWYEEWHHTRHGASWAAVQRAHRQDRGYEE